MKFMPLVDKLFWIISIPTVLLTTVALIISIVDTVALIITASVEIIILYFLLSPLFGYVELREECIFIKYGLFLSKEIPYSSVRTVKKARRWYSYSMMSLKNAIEHVEIGFNRFDTTDVSVVNNDLLIEEINNRIK